MRVTWCQRAGEMRVLVGNARAAAAAAAECQEACPRLAFASLVFLRQSGG